jgi:hypothetical protein
MEERMLHDEVQEWLGTKGVSLWANWLVTSEDGMAEATDWFVAELRDFWRHRMVARNFYSDRNTVQFDVV